MYDYRRVVNNFLPLGEISPKESSERDGAEEAEQKASQATRAYQQERQQARAKGELQREEESREFHKEV